jgi:hypothetical protein
MAKRSCDRTTGATSDVELYPRTLDPLCRAATGIESALLRAGVKFPYGGSVLAVAAKRGTAHPTEMEESNGESPLSS